MGECRTRHMSCCLGITIIEEKAASSEDLAKKLQELKETRVSAGHNNMLPRGGSQTTRPRTASRLIAPHEVIHEFAAGHRQKHLTC